MPDTPMFTSSVCFSVSCSVCFLSPLHFSCFSLPPFPCFVVYLWTGGGECVEELFEKLQTYGLRYTIISLEMLYFHRTRLLFIGVATSVESGALFFFRLSAMMRDFISINPVRLIQPCLLTIHCHSGPFENGT